jgi:hypothetical protein
MNFVDLIYLLNQATNGNSEPIGNVKNSKVLVGFSFGTRFDKDGELGDSGETNKAIAKYIVESPILRSKQMYLQEEVAISVIDLRPRLKNKITILKSVKMPYKTYNTHEILNHALPLLRKDKVRNITVVAFRYHLPRAAAQVKKAGFNISTTDMSKVGDWDQASSQVWTRRESNFLLREIPTIIALYFLNII